MCQNTFGPLLVIQNFVGVRSSLPNTNNKFTPENRQKKDEAIHFSEALAGC